VLYKWKANWTHDAGWRLGNSSGHGIHHRIFTDDEEQIFADEMLNASIVQGRQFGTSIFRELALARYARTCRDPAGFQCSAP
jgi:hypothetical protein